MYDLMSLTYIRVNIFHFVQEFSRQKHRRFTDNVSILEAY